MSTQFVTSLDEATLKKAKDELNEIASDRQAAIDTLREWVKKQPHLNSPDYDDWEYLTFLRSSKFSQLRAREMVEGNLVIRKEASEWFTNLDTRDPKLQAILDDGYVAALPKRTKEGCQILLYRPGCLDPHLKKYSRADITRAAMVVGAYANHSELTQVHGSVFIFDYTGFTTKHMTSQVNASDMKKFHKLWQKHVPGRFKQLHIYNAGTFFEAIMTITRPFLNKKYVDRLLVHSNLESLYKHVPKECLPEEYLPDDYNGPTIGSFKQNIESFREGIQRDAFRKNLLDRTQTKFGVDESKRPKAIGEVQQHFRKLNVD